MPEEISSNFHLLENLASNPYYYLKYLHSQRSEYRYPRRQLTLPVLVCPFKETESFSGHTHSLLSHGLQGESNWYLRIEMYSLAGYSQMRLILSLQKPIRLIYVLAFNALAQEANRQLAQGISRFLLILLLAKSLWTYCRYHENSDILLSFYTLIKILIQNVICHIFLQHL